MAYLSGSAPIFLSWIALLFGADTPEWVGFIPLLILFGYAIYRGTEAVDMLNRWMMIGMAICLFGILLLLVPHLRLEKLLTGNWSYLPEALSIVSVSFGFHIIIPSIVDYLDRDVKSIKKALVFGSLLPLVVYLIWEGVTLSVMNNFSSCPVRLIARRGLLRPGNYPEHVWSIDHLPTFQIFLFLFDRHIFFRGLSESFRLLGRWIQNPKKQVRKTQPLHPHICPTSHHHAAKQRSFFSLFGVCRSLWRCDSSGNSSRSLSLPRKKRRKRYSLSSSRRFLWPFGRPDFILSRYPARDLCQTLKKNVF